MSKRIGLYLIASLLLLTALAFAQAPVQETAPRYEGGPQPGAVAPQQPQRPQAPFELSPEQAAELDRFLVAWERRSQAVAGFKCDFKRWEYDLVFAPQDAQGRPMHVSEGIGVIKYAAPDKGLFHVKEMKAWNAKNQAHEKASGDQLEQWICDGKSVFQFDPATKKVKEYRIPAELQGKAIADGPLPFLFGSDAAKLKFRYFLRLVTPPTVTDAVWLEAFPKFQHDAANFQSATLIVTTKDMLPFAMQVVTPTGKMRTAFQFFNAVENPRTGLFERDFFIPRIPLGWKKVVEEAPGSTQGPSTVPPAEAGRAQAGRIPGPVLFK